MNENLQQDSTDAPLNSAVSMQLRQEWVGMSERWMGEVKEVLARIEKRRTEIRSSADIASLMFRPRWATGVMMGLSMATMADSPRFIAGVASTIIGVPLVGTLLGIHCRKRILRAHTMQEEQAAAMRKAITETDGNVQAILSGGGDDATLIELLRSAVAPLLTRASAWNDMLTQDLRMARLAIRPSLDVSTRVEWERKVMKVQAIDEALILEKELRENQDLSGRPDLQALRFALLGRVLPLVAYAHARSPKGLVPDFCALLQGKTGDADRVPTISKFLNTEESLSVVRTAEVERQRLLFASDLTRRESYQKEALTIQQNLVVLSAVVREDSELSDEDRADILSVVDALVVVKLWTGTHDTMKRLGSSDAEKIFTDSSVYSLFGKQASAAIREFQASVRRKSSKTVKDDATLAAIQLVQSRIRGWMPRVKATAQAEEHVAAESIKAPTGRKKR